MIKNSKSRTRNYATVIYPESAIENWKDKLAEQFIPAFISPLHDKDLNPTGEVKKAHYHVLIMFDGPKTIEQAQVVFGSITGVGCEVINSIRGYARYLCHLDNPEKEQYSSEDVVSLCGADYTNVIGLVTDKYKVIKEIMEYIRLEDIYSYSDLLDWCSMNRFEWFRVLCDNGTVVIKEYLKSRLWTKRNKY